MTAVLVDQHHADLLYALQRLFEDRLGFQVYVPKGRGWHTAGYWAFGDRAYGDDRMARQYLDVDANYTEVEPGLYLTFDPAHPERPIYGVSLDRAATMTWAAAVATLDDNQQGFALFAKETGARYCYHIGNARQAVDWSLDPLVLNAAERTDYPRGVDIGQEFDADTTFRYRPPVRQDRIVSFINLLPAIPGPWNAYCALRERLPGYGFRSFGHGTVDGNLHPVARIADEMSRAGWAFHDKETGDGFGHVIHNWAAIGRPLIGHASYYAGQRAEPLWRDGETCIDLDRHSPDEVAAIIRDTSPAKHEEMCHAIRQAFEAIYHPAADATAVASLLRGA